jgi:acyl carrier protein
MNIASGTPEGEPNRCPICDAILCMEPSQPASDAPCPHCGHLLWFLPTSHGWSVHDAGNVVTPWEKLRAITANAFGLRPKELSPYSSFIDDLGMDSLDIAELFMELEDHGFHVPEDEAANIKTLGDLIDYLQRTRQDHDGPSD